MQAIVHPSSLKGIITAPASKSAMQRACAAALVKKGRTILTHPGSSDDDLVALELVRQLGADVSQQGNTIIIESKGISPRAHELHCGESGLSLRLFTSLAAVSADAFIIRGGGSLLKRPVGFFDTVLPQLGVACTSQDGFLPLHIKGPLVPRDIRVDGSLSSQFLTGLLFAYAAAGASDVTIHVDDLNSKPYIDLTLQVMESFGLKAPLRNDYTSFYFPRQSTSSFESSLVRYTVEGDWSSASFLMVGAAISGSVQLQGLDIFSVQADKNILQALMQAEATLSIQPDIVQVAHKKLKPFHINATDAPDLFPPLAAMAAYCDGTSVIEGVHRLQHKESNRSQSLQEELGKLGVDIQIQDDLMIIKGGPVKGGTVSARGDHRIAMACAVAALGALEPVIIEGAGAVNKSYPQFWEHLQQLQCTLSLNHNS